MFRIDVVPIGFSITPFSAIVPEPPPRFWMSTSVGATVRLIRKVMELPLPAGSSQTSGFSVRLSTSMLLTRSVSVEKFVIFT